MLQCILRMIGQGQASTSDNRRKPDQPMRWCGRPDQPHYIGAYYLSTLCAWLMIELDKLQGLYMKASMLQMLHCIANLTVSLPGAYPPLAPCKLPSRSPYLQEHPPAERSVQNTSSAVDGQGFAKRTGYPSHDQSAQYGFCSKA